MAARRQRHTLKPISPESLEGVEIANPSAGKIKTATVHHSCHPVVWLPAHAMEVIWEPKGYNEEDASRVSLVMRPGAGEVAELDALDSWFVAYLTKNSDRLLGAAHTEEQVKQKYQSCLKRSERYGEQVRAKMNLRGFGKASFWDCDNKPTEAPEEFRGSTVQVQIHVKGIYIGKEVGPILEVTDVKMVDGAEKVEVACPFGEEWFASEMARVM